MRWARILIKVSAIKVNAHGFSFDFGIKFVDFGARKLSPELKCEYYKLFY